jgi:hypothetical protein
MSLLLAAALSGAGVAESADICRAYRWYPELLTTRAVYRPNFAFLGGSYIPPFADTPEAHAQTRAAAGIVAGASREISAPQALAERVALLRFLLVKVQSCARDIRSAQPMVRRVRGSPAT